MDIREEKFTTNKIKVFGIVQGVGFRPLVYRIAKKLGLRGTVRNVGGYVEILCSAAPKQFKEFLKLLQREGNDIGEIVRIECEKLPYEEWEDFRIISSNVSEKVSILPPDLPMCSKCQTELLDPSNRRYHNPFISCMVCGPRYTIMDSLPYDRERTTMVDFDMCHECRREYTSPEHRRFHAQTISCNDCGPYLIYEDRTGKTGKTALEKAISALKGGGILAVKGIGGYHLVCSPFMEETVQRLRRLKGREEKPFAVMFADLEQVEEYCEVTEEEKKLLLSKARPIVLLYMHKNTMAPSTNKGSIYCGAFLPYTPLQLLLLKACGPLIMTSANRSEQSIIKDDEEILSIQSPDLSGVLYHKRRILRSVDDSVARIIDGKPQLTRRSRGYVPYPVFLNLPEDAGNKHIFAAGGDLKAAFCLYKDGSAVLSQYFGDLEEMSVFSQYQKTYKDLCSLLQISPTVAVCDLHPNYHSTDFTKALGIPVLQVQHHHAHIASVMAEHHLQGKVIGVAFDGTGYGCDGNVWGGEFLICEGAEFERLAHLKYTPMLGGDDSMKDAAKTATCYLLGAGLGDEIEDERKQVIQAALTHRINTILSSSAGRLFDAVAAILKLGNWNRYEGECAICLEKEAVLAIKEGKEPIKLSFAIAEENGVIELDPRPVLEVLAKQSLIMDKGSLALGFHYAVAEAISETCEILREKCGSNMVALSGGVFQNAVLTERVLKLLREKKFQVYVNESVPPNDGGISLGQTYIGLHKFLNK